MTRYVWLALVAALAACDNEGGSLVGSDAGARGDAGVGEDAAFGDDAAFDEHAGDDAAVAREGLTLLAPSSVAPGMLFTVAVQSAEPEDRALTLCQSDDEVAKLRLYRGRGSASLRLSKLGDAPLSVCGDER